MTASAEDFRNWKNFYPHVQIVDRLEGVPVYLDPNHFQRRIGVSIAKIENGQRPARLIILKARRMGSSTKIQARFVHRMVTRKLYTAVTMAHKRDAAATLHKMSEGMYESLPEAFRNDVPRVAGERGKVLELGNGSKMHTETAGDREAGRAQAARALHASEFAFWPDARRTFLAIRQIVPEQIGTLVVVESTANGAGNPFHTEWVRAENGKSDYFPIFAPWFEFEGYKMAPDRGEDMEPADEDEEWLVGEGVGAEQLKWRRWAIRNLAGEDVELFRQEYPGNPIEAFLASGRPIFKGLHRIPQRDPGWAGDLRGLPVHGGTQLVRFEPDPRGTCRIWELPSRRKRYAIFGDPAGGLSLDRYEGFEKRADAEDYCAAYVIDLTGDSGLVAEYHARVDGDVFGYDLARLGYLFGGDNGAAKVAVEASGGYGNLPLGILQRELAYPDLYIRQQTTTVGGEWTERLGWSTSTLTRPLMIDGLKRALREKPKWFPSRNLMYELKTFAADRRGEGRAQSGCHDDLVMAAAGALEIYREFATRPITIEPPPPPPPAKRHPDALPPRPRERAHERVFMADLAPRI